MPELPEVETVRQTLKHFVLNKKIISADLRYPKIIEDEPEIFKQAVSNKKILDIDRMGKYLIFLLEEQTVFIAHLRMEGKFNIKSTDTFYQKHDHIIFHFDDGTDMRYNDTRKFGRMKLVGMNYVDEPPLSQLGKEPFDITEEELYRKIHHSSLAVKTVLLDQHIMSGIGNIYANEICFHMKIDPRTKASRLSKKRTRELIEISVSVLKEAIKQGGTTIHSFDANGIHGLFQVKLSVHGQKNCIVCKNSIKKIMLNGRGTYFCPFCQKKRY
ncbi:DNA-formamidopyrimidine glycosylase [Eggerthia catenaformis]|nr:DNA-formamidopyrimidine glycosylase [Eggerthia catenaformis]